MTLARIWSEFRHSPMTAIRDWQNHRQTWLIMLTTAVFLEICALGFQYVLELNPCEQCVYQRLAVMQLGFAALVIMVLPRNRLFRLAGYLIWISGAAYGLQEALLQIENYANFNPFFSTCSLLPSFPLGLPLHEWWPGMFQPTGLCGEDSWTFLSLNMGQWMTFIFGLYILAAFVCLASQLLGKKTAAPSA
ncbi:MAG: disulfide bond formation protein DsbB [Endozoicomonas sp.]